MRKLTNLQMGIIVNKIYRELSEKAEVINKAKLDEVDISAFLSTDITASLIHKYEDLGLEMNALDDQRREIAKTLKALSSKYSYSVPRYEDYVYSLKLKQVPHIVIDREEIEASVILSDVTDLDALIKTITDGIAKKYPELKN